MPLAPLPVLHDGGTWLAVAKPPGALVIPGRAEAQQDSLRDRLQAQLGRRIYVVHRLDRDTSGVLLFALTPEAHRSLSMAFEAGEVTKRYVALVEGAVDSELDLQVSLLPARKGKMRPAAAGEEGKDARTLVRPRERLGPFTWVEAEPVTGRTHQIRVHLRWAGHPLAVDPQYGRKEPLTVGPARLERTPLHAERLIVPSLPHVAAAAVEAPLPADLAGALEALRAAGR